MPMPSRVRLRCRQYAPRRRATNIDGEPSDNAGPAISAVVSQFTSMVADAAGDPALAGRTWVLLTEAVPGGWGLWGHANTNDELIAAARKQIAELQAKAAGPAS